MENNNLSGFETILDGILPGATKQKEEDIKVDVSNEPLTDEELDAIRNRKPVEPEDDDDDIEDDDDEPVKPQPKKSKKQVKEEDDDDDDKFTTGDDDTTDDNNNTGGDGDSDESNIVVGFFDSLSEKLGWEDVEEDKKPQTAEELIEYFYDVIEENSKPQYASEEIEALDNFVKNGGNLRDYLSIDAEVDLDNIDIEDDENAQKTVIKELLKEKGYNAKQIDKKISKYEDAGLLEDEAEDALEALRDIRAEKKEQLLANQQKAAKQAQKQQQEFFNNVVNEIKGMDSIYGVKIPEKDKKTLLEYIFKPDAEGMTQYRKDYAKSLKNLIASAYFTMKGDTLMSIAKKEGKRDAFTQFKNSLNKNSGISKKSKTQVNNDDSDTIWSSFTRRLRNAN